MCHTVSRMTLSMHKDPGISFRHKCGTHSPNGMFCYHHIVRFYLTFSNQKTKYYMIIFCFKTNVTNFVEFLPAEPTKHINKCLQFHCFCNLHLNDSYQFNKVLTLCMPTVAWRVSSRVIKTGEEAKNSWGGRGSRQCRPRMCLYKRRPSSKLVPSPNHSLGFIYITG